MLGRKVFNVTGVTFNDTHMVELGERHPVTVINVVAVVTSAREMVGIERVGPKLVAAITLSWPIGVLPILVTGDTFKLGMPTGKRIKAVVYILIQKGNRYKVKQCWFRRHKSRRFIVGTGLLQSCNFTSQCGHSVVAGSPVWF